jgi:hypothetical protein
LNIPFDLKNKKHKQMKNISLILLSFMLICASRAQSCIDALILKINNSGQETTDTLFCKIMSEDVNYYTVDNGFAITSIVKTTVIEAIPCMRQMTAHEIYKFKGIDFVTQDYFQNNNTVGNYFRKASFNMYLAAGLGIVAGVGIILGTTVYKNKPAQNYWIAGGGVVTAGSIFFMILAWNNVYKAGKLLDINEKTSLYLYPSQEGNVGLQLRF